MDEFFNNIETGSHKYEPKKFKFGEALFVIIFKIIIVAAIVISSTYLMAYINTL